MIQSEKERLQTEAWDNLIHSYGTMAVFRRRAARLRLLTQVRDFVHIALPCLLAFVYENFVQGWLQDALKVVVAALGLAQLLTAAWSMISRWDEELSYARAGAAENEAMFQSWERLAKSPPANIEKRFSELRTRNDLLDERDNRQDISQKERRYGMRHALHYQRRACAVCGKVPQSLKPTKCDCCGNF